MKLRLSESKYVGRNPDGSYFLSADVGPIADVHTHLALSYVARGNVDLNRECAIQLYLDPETPFRIDTYMNLNFDDESMRRMRHDLSIGSLSDGGMRSTHTAPNLRRSMGEINIRTSLILAIDLPIGVSNTDAYLTVAEGYEGLVPAAAIHPFKRHAEQALREAHRRGARAFKMHPAVQQMRPDHPRAMRLYEVCGELGIPVLWHCGPVGIVGERADARCQLKHYWRPIHDLPGTTFVLGHSGALQYEMGIQLARTYENVFLEISCQGLDAIKEILDKAPPERLMNGSDWPFYHQGISVLKLLTATEHNEQLRHQVLWKNADRLLNPHDSQENHVN